MNIDKQTVESDITDYIAIFVLLFDGKPLPGKIQSMRNVRHEDRRVTIRDMRDEHARLIKIDMMVDMLDYAVYALAAGLFKGFNEETSHLASTNDLESDIIEAQIYLRSQGVEHEDINYIP